MNKISGMINSQSPANGPWIDGNMQSEAEPFIEVPMVKICQFMPSTLTAVIFLMPDMFYQTGNKPAFIVHKPIFCIGPFISVTSNILLKDDFQLLFRHGLF